MSDTSESGFGARLRNAQDILSYITGFTGYSPPRTQESLTGFGTLLTSIVTANSNGTSLKNAYRVSVSQRLVAFKGTPGSVEKLLPLISGAVESQYGKTSVEYKSVAAIIKKMRSAKLVPPPTDPAPADAATAPAATTTAASTSEKSYGSMTQFFNDLKTTLAGFTGYNPSNVSIKLAALTTLSTSLTTLNNAVATALLNLKNARSARLASYADLKDRVKRIKAYVKAQYGVASNEYKLIKGINV